MEIPFDYILIHIMINLRNRKIKTKILKQNLAKIIDKIIYDLDISEKEKLETINNFDFEYELDTFYNNHIEYFVILGIYSKICTWRLYLLPFLGNNIQLIIRVLQLHIRPNILNLIVKFPYIFIGYRNACLDCHFDNFLL